MMYDIFIRVEGLEKFSEVLGLMHAPFGAKACHHQLFAYASLLGACLIKSIHSSLPFVVSLYTGLL